MTQNEKSINNFEISTINNVMRSPGALIAENLKETPLFLPMVRASPEPRLN